MLLSPAQSQIASDEHRFRVVDCGRRFGKTTLAILEMVSKAMSKNDLRICYIAPTYQQARDIAWDMLKNTAPQIITSTNESRLELTVRTIGKGTSQIWLRGWEAVETLRGQKFNFLVIDEVASMRKFWSNWQEVVRPTLTDEKGEALFISTPKGFNHFFELWEMDKKDPDYKSFKFSSYDNPHLPKEEIDKAALELSENAFAQEYMAEFKKMEGLVYKDFDRDFHVVSPSQLPEFTTRCIGIDFGYHNPFATVFVGIDYDDNWYIYDEIYQTGLSTDQQVKAVQNKMGELHYTHIIGDSAAAQSISDFTDKGLFVQPVNKEKDSIPAGIQIINDRLLIQPNNKARLYVSSECENTIWELENYTYPEKKDDKNESEDPIKENDHLLDALRYVALTLRIPEKTFVKRKGYYDAVTGRRLD